MTNEEKEEELLANDWIKRGHLWVHQDWLDEAITMNRESHDCPNWYRYETLDKAFEIENALNRTERLRDRWCDREISPKEPFYKEIR